MTSRYLVQNPEVDALIRPVQTRPFKFHWFCLFIFIYFYFIFFIFCFSAPTDYGFSPLKVGLLSQGHRSQGSRSEVAKVLSVQALATVNIFLQM